TYEDFDRFDDETKSYFKLVNPEDGIYEFIDPDSENVLNECPFLEKTENESIYKCKIYDMRPNSCRNYYC
ncbi:MAG: YkgJ family cysteine cluster protein, partial [Candidatus Thermoplasmatota archaeon]|nr:YkgJ family cysteine cluster protein [Candidatus Thermoplasmatota archaeon]